MPWPFTPEIIDDEARIQTLYSTYMNSRVFKPLVQYPEFRNHILPQVQRREPVLFPLTWFNPPQRIVVERGLPSDVVADVQSFLHREYGNRPFAIEYGVQHIMETPQRALANFCASRTGRVIGYFITAVGIFYYVFWIGVGLAVLALLMRAEG